MYLEKYERWVKNTDSETVSELEAIRADKPEIYDRFYRELEFGTGGLRGILGAGTNRMNVYTVRKATQGLASELLACGDEASLGVVIAHDSRNMSREFALEATRVLSANGIRAYLFESLRPTPVLSFAVRHLGAARGIVITASHNPREYNGYKVYGRDGGQIPPDTASRILEHIAATDVFDGVKSGDAGYIELGRELDDAYTAAVKAQSMGIPIPDGFKAVYTPLHGSGNMPVRRILAEIGVKNLVTVKEQEEPDGNFPTVSSPNPENKEALALGIEYAKLHGADLVLGTDPDCDRVGIAVKNPDGEYICLSGNQTGALLCEFILRKTPELAKGAIVKTIVTSELVKKIADSYGVETFDVLTGFKYIGEKIYEFEATQSHRFLFGLEESYGYLKGTYARDKDAVVASMLICEMAADYMSRGMTLCDGLAELYRRYGYTEERLVTKTLQGEEGSIRIKAIMDGFRANPPEKIGPCRVIKTLDYSTGICGLPRSNVLKYIFPDGWFALRPSGTEPKIKFYFGANAESPADMAEKLAAIEGFISERFG